ncbi:hypothetical protein AURDEDRAFT_175962 [Auricularia subglabra TFB-10046 SS5]|nr:hypothetical protein AURDEDRAFT_175962 [Auricularia subglabra TFB-10046 SS5]
MPAPCKLPPEFVTWATPKVRGYFEARNAGKGKEALKALMVEFDSLPFSDPSYSAYRQPDGTSKIDCLKGKNETETLRKKAEQWFGNNSRPNARRMKDSDDGKAHSSTRGAKATEMYFDSLEDDVKAALLDEIKRRLADEFTTDKERSENHLAIRDKEKARAAQKANREMLASPAHLAAKQRALVNEIKDFIEKCVQQMGTCGIWVHGVYMNEEKETATTFAVSMESRGEGWFNDSQYKNKVLPAWRNFGAPWCSREHALRKGTAASTEPPGQPPNAFEGQRLTEPGPDSGSVRGAPTLGSATSQQLEREANTRYPEKDLHLEQVSVVDDINEDDDRPASPRKSRLGASGHPIVESDDEDNGTGEEFFPDVRRSRTRSLMDEFDDWEAIPPVATEDAPSDGRLLMPPAATQEQLSVVGGRADDGLKNGEIVGADAGATRKGLRKRKAAESLDDHIGDAAPTATMTGDGGKDNQKEEVPVPTKKRKVGERAGDGAGAIDRAKKSSLSRELKALGSAGDRKKTPKNRKALEGRVTRRVSAGSGAVRASRRLGAGRK